MTICVPLIVLALWILQGTSFGNGLYGTFFSAVDEVLGTSFATAYGVDESTLNSSSYYRELLWKSAFGGTWTNPWIGKGGSYGIHLYIEGYDIQSCDNYYVSQYVDYAYPGLIAWIMMSVSFLFSMVRLFRKKMVFGYAMMVSFICYFISLWYLDDLQTFPIMMAVFGMAYAANCADQNNVRTAELKT
ncbi:MAG: hypothetical protein LUH07_00225 [Lachnospiraceae bacterium]|nr:hypothetical protein [Lachnospiraceae bacterium]